MCGQISRTMPSFSCLPVRRPESAGRKLRLSFCFFLKSGEKTRNHLDRTISITFDRATFFDETNAPWFRNVVGLLMAVVGLVLLIACANLANMLLARGNVRRHEIAVRRALGASRGRLLRQLLTESILLSLLGGAGGLVVALAASHLLSIALSRIFQTLLVLGGDSVSVPLTVDVRVFAYTLFVSVVAGIAFGLYPALQFFSKAEAVSALKDEAATSGQQSSRSRLRSLLVGGQFAVSLFLLICAGLLTQGVLRSLNVDPGYETRHVLMVDLNTGLHPSLASQRRVIDRLESIHR